MSLFNSEATVQIEDFQLRFDLWDDGPAPTRYLLNGFPVSEQRVPTATKDELHRLAWIEWRARGHGDYYEEDYEDGTEDSPSF